MAVLTTSGKTYKVRTESRSSAPVSPATFAIQTGATETDRGGLPLAIPREQMYYWSMKWQLGAAENRQALANGEFVEFDSDDPLDAARWLLSTDDE